MASVSYLPAGYSDSENEGYDDCDGYFFEKTKKPMIKVQKSEFEEFRDNLLSHLRDNNVPELRKTLDKGIRSGFDIDSPIDGHWNLLFYACSYGFSEVVEFLTEERGVNVDIRIDGETALMIVCSSTQNSDEILKIIKILHKTEPKLINRTNYVGENALMLAAKKGHLNVIEYLIKIGESYNIVNNSGRNVLFYAIEGNNIDIAKKLFELEIDLDVRDCYGTTPKKYAEECNAEEILELFPLEEYKYVTPSSYYSYSSFDSLVPNTLGENSIPSYFPDIVTMLRGMDCERFITQFSQANISLEQFLTIDEKKLEEIGIPLPYQRRMILLGLHNFFKAKWTKNSIYIPENIRSHLTPVDFVYLFANILRQTIVLKSQLIYLRRLKADYGLNYPFEDISIEHFKKFQNQIDELNRKMKTMKVTKRPLLIKKQTQSIVPNVLKGSDSYGMKGFAVKAVLPLAIISIIAIKYFRSK
ncbi:ankyrin repeat, SAM and basic leucine zipper domain-containing protein 1 [Chironomus tepperi]|uniref:ankyrin repeat, SAM and basic leucine zipper domain-containing protein 1 n=1 Tax=Chironomus tepperi TaxID=113505 RepID=UPI00391F57E5